MGVTYSCSGVEYDALDESLEALIRTISFKSDDLDTTFRSFSFDGRDAEPPILKNIGSGKMIIEGSLSFKAREADSLHLESKISRKSPRVQKIDSSRTNSPKPSRFKTEEANAQKCSDTKPGSPKHEAAIKLQKVYKSFRTRRKLADCAVLVEQRWWKLLDFALLKRSSVSFFHVDKPESVISRWARARTRAAKVGKGLSKDEKAQKLALQHWLEAIDPRHRYGHNLHFYYDAWLRCESRQPFFYWLDVGEGKEVNVERCPRSKLRQECIKYLGPKEREEYEVIVQDGRFVYKMSGKLLDTSNDPPDSKWIFVLSTSKKLYVGQKKKGTFQHSSFLAGGATSAAGRLVVKQGSLKAVWPHSGHYRPTEENFQEFVSFLRENNVDLTDVKKSPDDENEWGNAVSIGATLSSNTSRPAPPEPVAVSVREEEADAQQCHNSDQKDSAVNLEAKRTEEDQHGPSTAPAKRRPTLLSRLQVESSALDRLYALYVQKLFEEFEGESDDDSDQKDSSDEESKTTSSTKGHHKRSCTISSFSPEIPREASDEAATASEKHYKQNLFEEGHDEEEEQVIPRELILRRINSKKGMKSYQLGKQLSCKWTTGAGPRIGCLRDYPSELQFRALEQVNLSPTSAGLSRFNASSPHSLPASTPRTPGMSPLKVSTYTDDAQASR